MGDEDSGLAETLGYLEKLLLNLVTRYGIERAEGLTEEQHGRIGRQRPRHPDPLALSAGELSWVALHIMLGW